MAPELLLPLLLGAGCGGVPMDQQFPANRGRGYARAIDSLGIESTVPAPANQVWKMLPAVFTELGLEVNFREPANQRLGTCFQKVRTRLGKDLLSTFVDCGETRSLPNADRYELALTVLTTGDRGAREPRRSSRLWWVWHSTRRAPPATGCGAFPRAGSRSGFAPRWRSGPAPDRSVCRDPHRG